MDFNLFNVTKRWQGNALEEGTRNEMWKPGFAYVVWLYILKTYSKLHFDLYLQLVPKLDKM